MSTSGRIEKREINLNADTELILFDVLDDVLVSLQAEQRSSTWGTAVLNVVVSNTGTSPTQYDTLTLGPGNDMEKNIDVSSVAMIGVQVATVEGANEKATVTLCSKRDT